MDPERSLDATLDARDALAQTVSDEEEEASGLGPGVPVGRYVILGAIGSGAMGIVYAGYDPELDRKVAIKVLASPRASADACTRMHREAQAMARLSHPNVVTVHDVGTVEGRVWVAMEHVRGDTLKEWLARGPRPWPEALAILVEAGRGLAAAHAAGLVHRDIKPDNVMIGDDGRVRVMDFGLARGGAEASEAPRAADLRASSSLLDSELTHEGSLLGTPAYMAPEGLRGAATDARSDIFSWCVTAWEAIHGERPFAGDNLQEISRAVWTGARRPPPAGRRVPAAIRRILERGLAIDPRARFPTMAELLAAIERAQRRRRWRAALYGAAAIGAVAVAGVTIDRARDDAAEARCAAEGDALARSLRLAGAPRMARSFAATGSRDAPEVLARTMPWLRRHAQAWGAARRDLCRALAAEARAPTPTQERALACLGDRQASFDALLGILSGGDRRLLRLAIQAAAGLAPIAACTDPAALASAPDLPDDPALRAQVIALRDRFEQAVMLEQAGEYDAARATFDGVLADATALGWTPLRLSTRAALARVDHLQARYAEAAEALEAVIWEAEAAGYDPIVAHAASTLVDVTGHGQARREEALRWGRLAMAALRRARLEDDVMASDILGSLSILHETLGDLEAARQEKERMLAIRVRVLGPDHPSVAATHNMLGVHYLMRGDPAAARRHHERALAIRRAALGDGHLEVAISELNLGEVHLRTGDPARAIELFERARVGLAAAFGAEHPFTAAAVHNLADARERLGDHQAALAGHREALAMRERAFGGEHPEIGESHLGLAAAHRGLGDDAAAEADLRRALAIFEATAGPESLYAATALLRLGGLLVDRGEPAEARQALERARAIADKGAAPGDLRGAILVTLGRALWGDEGDRARALIDEGIALARGSATLDRRELAAMEAWIVDHMTEETGASGARRPLPPG